MIFTQILTDEIDLDGLLDEATALTYASINGNIELVQILIRLGADLNAKDKIHGWTPLMQATFYGQKEVAGMLLKAGADPTINSKDGSTALDLAFFIDNADPELVQILAKETIKIAPPSLMSLWPFSRPNTGLSRSISTPVIGLDKDLGKMPFSISNLGIYFILVYNLTTIFTFISFPAFYFIPCHLSNFLSFISLFVIYFTLCHLFHCLAFISLCF